MAVDTSTATNDWGFIDGSSESTEDVSGNVEVQAGAPLEGTNLVAAEADAVTGEGTAQASVEGTAALFESRLVAGGDADVEAREVLDVIAESVTTTGESNASATLGETETAGRESLNGGVIRSDQKIGGDYNLQSTVDNQTIAYATSTSEGEIASADAAATLLNSYGVLQTNIDVEGDAASVTVDVSDNTASSASTTSDGAEAETDRGEVTGIRFGAGDKLDVEGNGVVDVQVGTFLDPNTASAAASNTGDGDAIATLLTADNYGITGESNSGGGDEEVEGVMGGQASGTGGNPSNFGVVFDLTTPEVLDPQFSIEGLQTQTGGAAAAAIPEGDAFDIVFFNEEASISTASVNTSPFNTAGSGGTNLGSGTVTADANGTLFLTDGTLPNEAVGSFVIVGQQSPPPGTQESFFPTNAEVFDGDGGTIVTTGATIEIAGNGDVAAEVANDYAASATSTTGDAQATANTSGGDEAHIGNAETIGIDAALVDIDGDGVIEGSVENFTDVDAETVTGDADALSVSGLQAGIEATTLDVAGNAIIEGGVLNLQEASAKTTSEDPDNNGGADADTKSGQTTGIDAETVNLGGNAIMEGVAEVGQLAEADAVTGDAYANVAFKGDVKGINHSETTTAAGNLEVLAVGEALGLATASNVNASADSDSSSTNEDATASAKAKLNADVYGLDYNHTSGLEVGGNFTLEALADAQLGAIASSTNDEAKARSKAADVDITGAKLTSSGPIEIGGDATLIADAYADFDAAASTTNEKATAKSLNDADVQGLVIEDIEVGGALDIGATATSRAASDASTVTGKAKAKSDFQDDTRGLQLDDADVEGSASINAGAFLTGLSSATSTDGKAEARVEQDKSDDSVGALINNRLEVGGSAEINGDVVAAFDATANTTSGKAIAAVDQDDSSAKGVDAREATLDIEGDLAMDAGVIQVANASSTNVSNKESDAEVELDEAIGADLDKVKVSGAASVVGATATEANANAVSTQGDADADAEIGETKGVDIDSYIETGSSVNIDGLVGIEASASATSVGNDADAEVELDDTIQGVDAKDIGTNGQNIGGDASIQGAVGIEAFADATSTDGEADAEIDIDHESIAGFQLDDDFRVQGSSSIEGSVDSILGAVATSTGDEADAEMDLGGTSWTGVDMHDSSEVFTNGDLSLNGSVSQLSNAEATSVDGEADADFEADEYTGADLSDFVVGGSAEIAGAVDLETNASATSTDDDAYSDNEVDDAVQGVHAHDLEIAGNVMLDGNVDMGASADSTSVDGRADADNDFEEVQGLDIEELNVGGNALVNGTVNMEAAAVAESTGGTAEATYEGNGDDVEGVSFGNQMEVAGEASVTGQVTNTFSTDATSVDGKADSTIDVYQDTYGIEADDENIETGSDLSLTGSVTSNTDAKATSVEGKATADVDLTDDTYGIASAQVTVGRDLDLDATVDLDSSADAQSVSGKADADVTINDEEVIAWQSNGEVTIEGGATINAVVDGLLEASSDTTSGKATADIDLSDTDVIGVDAVEATVDVNGNLEMEASVSIDGSASASNTDSGSATANIQGDNFLGAITDDLDVAGDATRTATVDLNFNSDANSTANDATATVEFDLAIASLDGGLGAPTAPGALIGGDASIDAAATVNADASASTVGGNALAQNGEFNPFDNKGSYVGGYTIAGGKGQNVVPGLDVDGNASITASGTSNRSANAASTQGDADAEVALRAVTGLAAKSTRKQNGDINVEGNADLTATANADGIANANSTGTVGNDNAAFATVDQDQVIGLTTDVGRANDFTGDFPSGTDTELSFGGNVEFVASALNTQQANAGITNGDAQAWTGLFDETIGVLGGDIDIDGNATGFVATASLNTESNADSVTSEELDSMFPFAAYADAGSDSSTAGMVDTDIHIDGNVSNVNGLVSLASTTLVSNAEATTGSALAKSSTFMGDGVQTIGAQDVDLDVSGNVAGEWGVRGIATSDIAANAATVTGEDAEADILATTIGWNGGDVDISGNGNITAIGSQVANAAADIVTSYGGDTATSTVELTTAGAVLDERDITIGGNGSIAADGFITGSSLATGVTSASDANANLDADGLELTENSVTIDGSGSITARALIGSWGINSLTGDYQASEAFEVAASSVTGDSTSTSESTVNGLSDGFVTAGPSGGDILGVASAHVNASSHTTDGTSTATNNGTMNGINMVEITGGQAGSNLVDGRAIGVFNTTASNTNGDATATSNTSAKGMAGDMSSASNNGTFYGLADLSNTVVASTVTGAASATATGSAIGIDQYSLTMEGDGVITANASVNSVARSSTISGSSI